MVAVRERASAHPDHVAKATSTSPELFGACVGDLQRAWSLARHCGARDSDAAPERAVRIAWGDPVAQSRPSATQTWRR